MIDFSLFVNAAKFLMSKEVRASAASIVDAVKRSPEWKKDLITIEAVVAARHQERSVLVRDLVSDKLREIGYVDDTVASFEVCYSEIVRNAFEHGLKAAKSHEVRIITDVSPSFVATVVRCSGAKLGPDHLRVWLNVARSRLRQDSFQPRGRGLLLVSAIADELRADPPDGVKYVIFREQVRLGSELMRGKYGDIVVLSIEDGIASPSLSKRLLAWFEENVPMRLVLRLDSRVDSEEAQYLASYMDRATRADKPEARDGSRAHTGSTTVAMIVLPRFRNRNGLWRIVCEDQNLLRLLPAQISHPDVASAIAAIDVSDVQSRDT